MPTVYGFVQSLETRGDGWVELSLLAVHASNTAQTLFIENVDGDLAKAHRKLAQLGLLRDALARTLPVAVDYRPRENQGNIIDDVTVYPTCSIEGRRGKLLVEGVVVGVGVTERSPESTSIPYRDEADIATVALLGAGGSIDLYKLDLQRPHPGTGQSMLAMCQEARRTRRRIRLNLSSDNPKEGTGFIVGCGWIMLATADLTPRVVFVERIGERSESYATSEVRVVDRLWVKYTTAPEQTPEGDVSQDDNFTFESGTAWIHRDAPMVKTLVAALRDRLQVRLGLAGDEIHEVEVIAPLGSAARPIWIQCKMEPVCDAPKTVCVNTPTIEAPARELLFSTPQSMAFRGNAYFAEGIWRFEIQSGSPFTLAIDGAQPCCDKAEATSPANVLDPRTPDASSAGAALQIKTGDFLLEKGDRSLPRKVCHVYLNGMHAVEVVLRDRTCRTPFRLAVNRIR